MTILAGTCHKFSKLIIAWTPVKDEITLKIQLYKVESEKEFLNSLPQRKINKYVKYYNINNNKLKEEKIKLKNQSSRSLKQTTSMKQQKI